MLSTGDAKSGARAGRALSGDLIPTYPKSLELRVLTGLYFHRITEKLAKTFFEDTWTVAPEADRIGYRFRKGRALSFRERKQPFGAGPIRVTSSMRAIRTGQSRYRAVSSLLYCIAMPYPAADMR